VYRDTKEQKKSRFVSRHSQIGGFGCIVTGKRNREEKQERRTEEEGQGIKQIRDKRHDRLSLIYVLRSG